MVHTATAGGSLARSVILLLALASPLACSTSVDGKSSGGGDGPAGTDGGTAAGDSDGAFVCGSKEFNLTETPEFFEVPANVLYMHVKAWGAGANGESNEDTTKPCNFSDGGLGGYTEAVFDVTPGTPLTAIVGQRGRRGTADGAENPERFGFGAHGGGGLTGVFRDSEEVLETDAERALVIAGGGGSAGWEQCRPGGTGNHPSAGGQAGSMMGGLGAGGDINGGGGGYEGGSGGATAQPGKGGMGYVSPDALESVMEHSEPGDRWPPRTDDPDYDGRAGTTELPGLLVVYFTCTRPELPGVD